MPGGYEVVSSAKYHGKAIREIPAHGVWSGFMDSTTAHGIPHVRNARGWVKTTFWTLATLTCIGSLFQQGYVLIDKYMTADVAVQVSIEHATDIIFPAVTVCNNNPLLRSKIMENYRMLCTLGLTTEWGSEADGQQSSSSEQDQQAKVVDIERKPKDGDPQPTTTSPTTADDTTEQSGSAYGGSGTGFMDGSMPGIGGRKQRVAYERQMEIMQQLADLPYHTKAAMGYQLDDLIIDCEYSGTVCNSSTDFTAFYSNWFGNCYTFNSNWNKSFMIDGEMAKSFRPGPQYGLALTFNVDQEEYIGELAQSAGIRVVVHSQNRMPFPEDEGVAVAPGSQTFIGVTKVYISREGGRYGDCSPIDARNTTRSVFEELHPVNYSITACYKTCYQYNVIMECGCGDSQYPMEGSFIGNIDVNACNYTSMTDVDCMDAVESKYMDGSLACQCPSACTETTFNSRVSSELWPSENYKHDLFEALASTNDKIRIVLNKGDEYKKNLGKVVIFFQEFNYQNIQEKPLYILSSLISDMGGILGLFIGFSFLTVGEFIELAVDMSLVLFIKWFPSNKLSAENSHKGNGLKPASNADSPTESQACSYDSLSKLDNKTIIKDHIGWISGK